MDIREAIQKAIQILDEERSCPTVKYVPAQLRDPSDYALRIAAIASVMNIHQLRQQHPRTVSENPEMLNFQSTNHVLLRVLLAQLPQTEISNLLVRIAARLRSGVAATKSTVPANLKWNSLTSDLPLVLEFLVRNGGKAYFFTVIENARIQFIPGHILLFMQLEELIAFNYSQFTDSEYERLSSAVGKLGTKAAAEAQNYRARNVHDVRWPEVGSISAAGLLYAIQKSCNGIVDQSRKARYFYLKGSLEQGLNLEVNQDKTAVRTYLQQFGFSPTLIETLDEAERFYLAQGTPFDSKNSLGHLRSFLENVQKESMPNIHSKFGGDLRLDWGGGLAYLTVNSVLSKAEEQFAVGLYRLISDEGVHPLIAQREYVRLARNMVVEYALLYLTKIQKLGLTIKPSVLGVAGQNG